MKNKKLGGVALVLSFLIYLLPFCVWGASTTDAVEPIMPDEDCTLSVTYKCGETVFSGVEVRIYRFAEVSESLEYTLTPSFEATGLIINGIKTSGEWNVVRFTLQTHIIANGNEPDAVCQTDENGQIRLDGIKTGLYLAIVGQAISSDVECDFDSAIIALPGLDSEGRWQYGQAVNAKGEILPPVGGDEETELKVVKLWRGDGSGNGRPESIEVEIFRNGVTYDTVTLNADTNWSYSWSAKDDGSSWTVIEKNVPQGYTMTVEERDTTFVLTNTLIPTDPDNPDGPPPPTSDAGNVLLYVLVMAGFGMLLIIFGVAGKRKRL